MSVHRHHKMSAAHSVCPIKATNLSRDSLSLLVDFPSFFVSLYYHPQLEPLKYIISDKKINILQLCY